ncbi:MAG: hypothetical protein ABI380_10565 [Edaphobacter sp.]
MQAILISLDSCPIVSGWDIVAKLISGWDIAAKWVVPILSGLFISITFLMTYWYNVSVRAGDLVLKLEEAFIKLGSNLAFLEYKETCYDGDVQSILQRCTDSAGLLDPRQRKTLEDVDQCIRFLFICTLLAGKKIPFHGKRRLRQFFFPSRLVSRAYYFYLDRLSDRKNYRPELRRYIKKYFRLLDEWLLDNKEALASYVTPSEDEASNVPQA